MSTTYAGRAMLGWSWPLTRWAFITVAGASVGRESGREENQRHSTSEPLITRPIERTQADLEGYFRMGLTL